MATRSGAFTVKVKGYRECMRALNQVDKGTRKAMLDGLKKAAEPVSQDARSKLSKYNGLDTGSIQPRAVSNGVFITQKRGKKTGTRPDFGSLQMQRGLIPAAYDGQDLFVGRVEDELDDLIRGEGF